MERAEKAESRPVRTTTTTTTTPTTTTPTTPVTSEEQNKNYLGCTLSLISKSEIRYVGTLVLVNSQDQTLTLQNVQSFGSEGRRGGGENEISASDESFEYIIFRATDLKDFSVMNTPGKVFKDPAIISSEAKTLSPLTNTLDSPQTRKYSGGGDTRDEGNANRGWRQGYWNRGGGEYKERGYRDRGHQHERAYRGYGRGGYRGGGYHDRGGYQGHSGHSQSHPLTQPIGQLKSNPKDEVKLKYKEDFDFEAMNLKFEKLMENCPSEEREDIRDVRDVRDVRDEISGSHSPSRSRSRSRGKYNKSKSFFDSISTSVNEEKGIYDREAQRALDLDTFGNLQVIPEARYDSRGRGYRGYRRFRGGERGGSYRYSDYRGRGGDNLGGGERGGYGGGYQGQRGYFRGGHEGQRGYFRGGRYQPRGYPHH